MERYFLQPLQFELVFLSLFLVCISIPSFDATFGSAATAGMTASARHSSEEINDRPMLKSII
ncbi:Uncharacterized protein APZ42_000115 [Daphnia magna]|uniref:Uncharacterized protein n=1 Tax=Daphnia magna TaxID=35525 RepID=A0A164JWM2_9CRUS|nr:Uncharacterized protein APZ42_000115 [Daphnia magna]